MNRDKDKIVCLLHGKEFIGLDTHIFKICCKKCNELQLENKEQNLVKIHQEYTSNENSSSKNKIDSIEEGDIECPKHPAEKGIFYCDDCNDFLCKACFANDHRTHNSNMPKVISDNLKNLLSELITTLKELNIEETLKNMQELSGRLTKQRKESSDKNMALQSNILKAMREKSGLIKNGYNELFGGLDNECDAVSQRIQAFTKKINKYITELTECIKKVSELKTDKSICKFHKEKKETLMSIRKFIEDSSHFFKVKIEDTRIKIEEKSSIIKQATEKYSRNQTIFENSVSSSINSGITSESIRLRRFVKFDMMCKYYKTSSLVVKVDHPISLVGLGICGLYPLKVIKKEVGGETKPALDLKENGKSKTKPKQHTTLYENKVTTIPIKITLAEIKNEEISENKLIEFNYTLPSVINYSDPIITIYFPKALNLKADAKYIITINNTDKNSMYLQIFGGTVPSVSVDSLYQKIKCNNSGFNFQVYCAQGVESDFNEFNYGIIADLMYCYVG